MLLKSSNIFLIKDKDIHTPIPDCFLNGITRQTVIEMVKAFEKGSGKTIPYKIAPRRSGDVAACYADPTKAATELSWHAEKGLEDMCADTWNWQSQNPMGYPKD